MITETQTMNQEPSNRISVTIEETINLLLAYGIQSLHADVEKNRLVITRVPLKDPEHMNDFRVFIDLGIEYKEERL